MDIWLRLAVVLVLIAANGFFVAGEFALVTARRTRIEQLAARGNRAAIAVLKAMQDPNRFISACQLGITVASLALGWVGEEAISSLIEPLLWFLPHEAAMFTSHTVSVALAFIAITFFHIALGEQVPKMLALQKGETVAMIAVNPTNVLGWIGRPFIALLSWFTEAVLRALGLPWNAEEHQTYSAEDLKLLVRASQAAGTLEHDPDRLVERALDFAGLAAHHTMVPRTEMIAVPIDVTLTRLADTMRRNQHSRYPVFEGSPDNIVGVLSAKNLAAELAEQALSGVSAFDVRQQMSIPMFVPETMRADKLLSEMKRNRSHLAIVVDEYGVTAGLVSIRDLMDRIAGEVRDEAEEDTPTVQRLPDGSALIDGLALLTDLEPEFGLRIDDGDYDTLGGFIFGRLGRRPVVGDSVVVDGKVLTVDEVDGFRVSRVRVSPRTPDDTDGEEQRAAAGH